MRVTAISLVLAVICASGCRTAEPLPEVMSDAEFEARMDALDEWREAETQACGEDVECKKAVMREYMARMDALFDEQLAQVRARWDAQRRR